MASTGNTQGIRFSTMPPSSAPSNASAKAPAGTASRAAMGAGAAPTGAALDLSAASSAGDTPATGASAGQAPCTWASARQPWPPATSTSGMCDGLSLRSGDTGRSAVQAPSSQRWVQVRGPAVSPGWAAVRITPGVSGNSSRFWPRSAAGSPFTRTCRRWPPSANVTLCSPASGLGCALRAASNAGPFSAVELRSGSLSENSPSCGMHSTRHTSQLALSRTSRLSSSTDGL